MAGIALIPAITGEFQMTPVFQAATSFSRQPWKILTDPLATQISKTHFYSILSESYSTDSSLAGPHGCAAADEQVLAYCIRPLAEPDAAPIAESRAGLAVVYWTIRNFGFLIAGKTSPEAALRAANVLHENARQQMRI
jgi:hypothetical protein